MRGFRFKQIRKKFSETPSVKLPQTLSRKRVYILPNRYGWMFILVLFALLVGSVNYKNNLGFILTFLLSGMFIVSLLYTYRNLSGIQICSVTAEPVFAGERAVFKLHIRTDALSRAVVVFALLSGEETNKDLAADSDNWIDVSDVTVQRGIFKPGGLRISTQYPLGLFRAWSKLHLDMECLVFPKPLHGPFEPLYDSPSNLEEGRQGGVGVEDFQGLRSYKPGDPIQHISWKAYSRGQGLFTKEFVGQTGTSTILDWKALKDQNAERKLSRLCDMVIKAGRLNIAYGLKLPGKTIDPDRGEAHRKKCLKALALYALPAGES